MEILSETTQWGGYLFAMTIIVTIAIALAAVAIWGIVDVIRNRFTPSDIVIALVFSVLASLMAISAVIGIKDGPTTEYKAIVTDYNVIYEEGYEIISTEGKIVTLTKE